MIAAKDIIKQLVLKGVIPQEYAEEAAGELHRELSRRSRRVAQTLAVLTSTHQLAVGYAEVA